MSTRATSWLAWSLAALSIGMFFVSVALYIVTLPVQPPVSWGTGGVSTPFYALLPFLSFPIVGALVASRRPTNPIGWLSLAVGLIWMLNMIFGSYMLYGLRMAGPASVPYSAAVGSLAEWLGPTAVMLFGTYLILLFPDGTLPSSRWRPFAWLCGVVIVSNFVVTTLAPGPLSDLRMVNNPFGLEGYPWMANVLDAIGLLLPLCTLASASSLILRYLRSGALSGELTRVVRETVQPEHVSIWLRPARPRSTGWGSDDPNSLIRGRYRSCGVALGIYGFILTQ
jgi:hypothetical protein